MIVVSVVTQVIDLANDWLCPCQFTLSLKNWVKKGLKVLLNLNESHVGYTEVTETLERKVKASLDARYAYEHHLMQQGGRGIGTKIKTVKS